MPGSGTRAAVPDFLSFTVAPSEGAEIVVHKTVYREDDGFLPKQVPVESKESNHYWSFWFSRDHSVLEARFDYSALEHGQPPRRPARLLVFRLEQGEVGSFRINGRHASSSGQWYSKHVVNIANAEILDVGLFSRARAWQIVDKQAELF